MKLAAARIFVDDLPAARRFYALLGLALLHDGVEHGFCVYDAGGFDLVVEQVGDEDEAADRTLVGRFTGLSFAVADLAAAHARLSAAGVPFSGPPEQQSWGGWLATLRDPAGNELQLAQYPAGEPDDRAAGSN